MWKKIGLFALVSMMAAYGLVSVVSGGEELLCIPTGSISIEPPASVASKKGPVEFPHSLHFSYTCQTCHHTWDGGPEILGCMTSGCHDMVEKKKGVKNPAYYKDAYHTKCIGCHKSLAAKNARLARSKRLLKGKIPATGPTGCVECHG